MNADIKAIKERCDKATPGPWLREIAQDGEYTGPGDNPPGYAGDYYETNDIVDTGGYHVVDYVDRSNDADFIAHAREDIPALIAEIESLQAQLAESQRRESAAVHGYWEGWTKQAFIGVDEFHEPKWADRKYYECSVCRRGTAVKSNFCPNCGADMGPGEGAE